METYLVRKLRLERDETKNLEASIDFDQGTAKISNGLIQMEFDFNGKLRLTSFVNLETQTQWIPQPPDFHWGSDEHREALICGPDELWPDLAPPSNEFLLECSSATVDGKLDPTEHVYSELRRNGLEITGASPCKIVPEKSEAFCENGKIRLDITMAIAGEPLQITVHTEMQEGVPIVRRWTTVTNVGKHPLLIYKLLSLLLSVRPSYADLDLYWVEVFKHDQRLWRQCTVHQERITAAVRRKLLFGPYSRYHDGSNGSMGWAALRDPAINEGLFLGWEWSGDFDAEIGDFREGAGVFGIRLGFSDSGNYWRKLHPGESFSSPKAFAGFFKGEIEDAARTTRKTAEKVFGLPWPEGRPPMFVGHCTWNNWQDWKGDYRNHLRPERLDDEIRIASDLGVELFILDYDWFPRLGDWWSDPERFPEGVESISEKVKSAGMKFGLWMGFGQVHEDSKVAKEHPEWLVTKNSCALPGGWNMHALCLGYPPCRDWVLEQVSNAVERFKVDWLKHDFDLIPISDAHHHAPNASDSRIETVEGYYYILEKLRERFPNLYLDNWTPATGGADFGNFQRHHSMLLSDWYSAISVRSALNGITHLFPNFRTHTYLRMFSPDEERSPYHYRSGAFGNGVYLLNDLLLMDEKALDVARREIQLYKEDRVLFETGELYTLISRQPDHYGWEARFVYCSQKKRGMAQVFRNHDREKDKKIFLRGLDPDLEYNLVYVDAGLEFCRFGSELMEKGILVRLSKPFSSEIIRVEAKKGSVK